MFEASNPSFDGDPFPDPDAFDYYFDDYEFITKKEALELLKTCDFCDDLEEQVLKL